MTALEPVAEDLWIADDVLPLPAGARIPARMAVVRLGDGGLWLCSPARPTDELIAQVSALGPVRHLVAPNRLHHLFIGAWRERFPEARMHGAPGLAKKRKDLSFDAILGEATPPWHEDIDQVLIEGAPRLGETVFLHRASRTLLVSDLVFNLVNPGGWRSRLVFKLTGVCGHLAQSREWRLVTRDRPAAARSVERMLAWDFDRLVPAHGDIIPSGARPMVAQASAWMRGA